MNDHLYLTLPSDSSVKYYPNNTIARFVTKLPETIRLHGHYEMALAEIIYPHTWYNLNNDDERYWVSFNYPNVTKKVPIPSGYYDDGHALLDVLDMEHMQEFGVRFSYNRTSSRFNLTVRPPGQQTFEMSKDLQTYMGLEIRGCDKSYSIRANTDFDANRGLNLMYVYCDVASHSIVGDTKTPLLRVCNITGKHRDFVRHTYNQPHYVPVGRHEFDTIEIAIYNELGKPMPFQYGKSVVTIHFRRRWTITSI